MGDLYLGLDVGTQATKALLIELEARAVVARASRSYPLLPDLPPGAAEQEPETWWRAAGECVRELGRQVNGRAIRALGVSGQQHGFVALDAQRRVLRPAKLWCDTSTAAEARELSSALGRSVPTGFTASKILWLKRREPERFARLAHVLLPHDYVNLRLTGRLAMEAGDASGTGFFDPVERRFDGRACAAIDERLAGMLPPLVAAEEPLGRIDEEVGRELGLAPDALVAPGGGDNMCAAIGSGATRAGICVLSLGTSGTIFTYSERPVLDPSGLIAPFCDSTGAWLPLLCVMNATGVLNEVQAAFRASGLDLARLTELAADIPPGSDGLLFLPYLQGERVPDLPEASATLLGLRPALLEPARLFRAALEGTSLNLAWGVERLGALGIAPESVRLVGGGARNRLWAGILADVLGVPVQRPVESESAALGAALQAAWVARRARGERTSIDALAQGFVACEEQPIHPDPERSGFYRSLLARFRTAVGRVYG
jgi:xylulokinase